MVVSEGTRRRRASSSDRPRNLPLSTLRWYSRNPSRVSRSPATATRSSSSAGGAASVTAKGYRRGRSGPDAVAAQGRLDQVEGPVGGLREHLADLVARLAGQDAPG